MAQEIRIQLAYLDTLAYNSRTAAANLEDNSTLNNLSFAGNSEVEKEFDNFWDRWDRNRKSLREGVERVGDSFQAVHDAFATADDDLAAQLSD